jgi:ribosomal protein L37AE/L43A
VKHKRFVYVCPSCSRTGLVPDSNAVYQVRVCDACKGLGKAKLTVMERIQLDGQKPIRGGETNLNPPGGN